MAVTKVEQLQLRQSCFGQTFELPDLVVGYISKRLTEVDEGKFSEYAAAQAHSLNLVELNDYGLEHGEFEVVELQLLYLVAS